MTTPNGWNEWKNKVLSDNEDTKEEIKKLRSDFSSFKTDVISELKVINIKLSWKAGIVGGLSGLLTAIGIILIYLANS